MAVTNVLKFKTVQEVAEAEASIGLQLPGELTPVGWVPPRDMDEVQWTLCLAELVKAEAVTPWALGDGWVWGSERKWGKGQDLAQVIGKVMKRSSNTDRSLGRLNCVRAYTI
jgi:hypothetical protein